MLVRRLPPLPSRVLTEVFERLSRRGFDVETGIAEEAVLRPDCLEPRHDLYILKSHTELSLSLAGILHAQGARLLNPYPSCIATQNKIVASKRLRAAGVPTPRSWVTGDLMLLEPIADKTAIIIKPYLGHRGAGIRVVQRREELASIPPPEGPVLVQEYVEGNGEDLKVYVIDDEVFAVRKPFSTTSFTQPGRPTVVSDDVRRIALAVGRALGLSLYGLDVIEGSAGPVVVDVNYFPGYKGVAEAPSLIADHIEKSAHGRYPDRLSPESYSLIPTAST